MALKHLSSFFFHEMACSQSWRFSSGVHLRWVEEILCASGVSFGIVGIIRGDIDADFLRQDVYESAVGSEVFEMRFET